jgi:hypothetical protein
MVTRSRGLWFQIDSLVGMGELSRRTRERMARQDESDIDMRVEGQVTQAVKPALPLQRFAKRLSEGGRGDPVKKCQGERGKGTKQIVAAVLARPRLWTAVATRAQEYVAINTHTSHYIIHHAYPQSRNQPITSSSVKLVKASSARVRRSSSSWTKPSKRRRYALRKENISSMGLKSGEYGGRYTSRASDVLESARKQG